MEVDTETGEVIIRKVVNVNDVGKVINWEGCEGQQYGGTYMGVGRGLFEEVVHDPVTGVMLNGNLLDYKFCTMNDVGPIETALVETGMGYGPYGVVGIGEDIATRCARTIRTRSLQCHRRMDRRFPDHPRKGPEGVEESLVL